MQLDRFTEKAQEAIVAAQQLAERLHSPVLDVEHILSALVEPDDGIPAETLRRLGVDLAAFRGELAAQLARRAHIEGGQLTLDARAKRLVERAQAEARRLGDEYTSTDQVVPHPRHAAGAGRCGVVSGYDPAATRRASPSSASARPDRPSPPACAKAASSASPPGTFCFR